MKSLVDRIKEHESYRRFPYKDTVGHLTIGYGRNLDAVGIAPDEAEVLLANDIESASRDAEKFPWYAGLSPTRREVIVEMIFNIGVGGLLEFKKMIAAIKRSDFEEAAVQMLDSQWHRQVGDRAVELAEVMRSGVTS